MLLHPLEYDELNARRKVGRKARKLFTFTPGVASFFSPEDSWVAELSRCVGFQTWLRSLTRRSVLINLVEEI